jgi:hypothetical protein
MRRLSLLLSCLLIAGTGISVSPAQAATGDISVMCSTGTFTVNANVVTGNTSCSGTVVIPEGVTSIGREAFIGATLTSIIIPNTVTSIGERAFLEAVALKEVAIPNSVTVIGDDAFVGIGTLESFTVGTANPNYRDIDGVLFNKLATKLIVYPASKAVTSYDIPNSVTSIWRRSFWGAGRLTRITIPNSVTSIGNQSFLYTGGLASITIPNSVTFIDANAFQGSGIRNITIPNSVTEIGNDVFFETGALESVRFLGTQAPIVSNLSAPASAEAVINPGATGFTPIVDGKWNGLILVTADTVLLAAEAAASVDALIVALPSLGSINTASSTAIASARAAFTALNEAAKALVTTLSILVAAEEKRLSLNDSTPDDAAARAAAAKREAEKISALSEIAKKFKNSEKVDLSTFKQAEISGITTENIDALHIEIFALSEGSRTDITQVLKVARKYEVVGMIASSRVSLVLPQTLIEIGLIASDNKSKSAITAALRKLPVEKRSDFGLITGAIADEMVKIQTRKDRLAKVISHVK